MLCRLNAFRKLLDAGLPEDTVFVKLNGSAGTLVVILYKSGGHISYQTIVYHTISYRFML